MGIFSKKVTGEALTAANNIINNVVTSQEERGMLKNQFTDLLTQMEMYYEDKYTQRYISDNRDGNWLSKAARPTIAILLTCACIAILFVPIPEGKEDYTIKFVTFAFGITGSFFGLREIGKAIRNPIQDYNRKLRRKG